MSRINSLHLSATLLLLSAAGAAQAQPTASVKTQPAESATDAAAARVEALTRSMSQALQLTPAQTERVRAINTTAVRNVEAARRRYRDEPRELRGYVESISLARLDRLKEVLTPAQFARFQQKREEKMGIPKVGSNQGNPVPGLRGE